MKGEGMKGEGESAAGMRPKKAGPSFLCAWLSAGLCPLEGHGGLGANDLGDMSLVDFVSVFHQKAIDGTP